MKTLVIVTHPDLETSVINKRLVEEFKKYPEKYTVQELSKVYPDGNIDVEKEQKLVESHGKESHNRTQHIVNKKEDKPLHSVDVHLFLFKGVFVNSPKRRSFCAVFSTKVNMDKELFHT